MPILNHWGPRKPLSPKHCYDVGAYGQVYGVFETPAPNV